MFGFILGGLPMTEICDLCHSSAEVDTALALVTSYVTARGRPARRMKSFSVHGRNAVVTGASRGIGRAIALRLAEVGANVALTYRERADAAHQVAREIEEKDASRFHCKWMSRIARPSRPRPRRPAARWDRSRC